MGTCTRASGEAAAGHHEVDARILALDLGEVVGIGLDSAPTRRLAVQFGPEEVAVLANGAACGVVPYDLGVAVLVLGLAST